MLKYAQKTFINLHKNNQGNFLLAFCLEDNERA